MLSALARRRSCNSGLQVRSDRLAAAPRCLLTDVLLVLLLLELTHNSPAHIPDVLARLERNAVPLVQVLAVSAHLLDEHLTGLLVNVVERLFFVVGVRFWQVKLRLDSIFSAPTKRHPIRRLYITILCHIWLTLMSPVRLIQLGYEMILCR